MTPPNAYSRRCDAWSPGAQRIGFEWFSFVDPDALSRALNDGMFERAHTTLVEKVECLNANVSSPENDVSDLEKKLSERDEEIAELKRQLEEGKK